MFLLYILWDDWPIFMISGSNEQLQPQLEYTQLNPDCHSWWISKIQSDTLEERYAIKYTRMLRAILNKSWKQRPTKQYLYGHLPPITKTIQVRRTRHAVHRWRSRDELISDLHLWTPSHGRAKAGRPDRTNIQQLCADTRCSLEDLLGVIDDRDGWRERVREIHAGSVSWWWWWWWYIRIIFQPIYLTHIWDHTSSEWSLE